MDRMIINGGKILSASVRISGAKNSAVALIPAAILSDDIVKINGVPNISDIKALEEILVYLGAKITNKNGKIVHIKEHEELFECDKQGNRLHVKSIFEIEKWKYFVWSWKPFIICVFFSHTEQL